MPGGDYVDRAKEKLLYEFEGGNDDVRLMLSKSDVNSRTNMEMSRFRMATGFVDLNWRGKWAGFLKGFADELERNYMCLNGYARVQAIEMKGQSSIAEREVLEKKERGGILGLFSGK